MSFTPPVARSREDSMETFFKKPEASVHERATVRKTRASKGVWSLTARGWAVPTLVLVGLVSCFVLFTRYMETTEVSRPRDRGVNPVSDRHSEPISDAVLRRLGLL